MRYQTYTERLTQLRQAAGKGGWVLRDESPDPSTPFWVAEHPESAHAAPRIAWSFMHGNEPTGFEALCQWMALGAPTHNWTLIPLVNPTGIHAFTRLTRDGVDLNRRAREVGPLEADLLKQQLQLKPYELALNLHDQRSIFHPHGQRLPSSLSVLAPRAQFEHGEMIPDRACRWAGSMVQWMRAEHPNWGYARFDDTYYPTAFGEWVQELGIPTVTVETGITLQSADRSAVVAALSRVVRRVDAANLPPDEGAAAYWELPKNEATGCDLALRSGEEVSYWKLLEMLQDGTYISGLERLLDPACPVAYTELEVSPQEFRTLNERTAWNRAELYTVAGSALRTFAEGLPR